jgi:hypothetical protein
MTTQKQNLDRGRVFILSVARGFVPALLVAYSIAGCPKTTTPYVAGPQPAPSAVAATCAHLVADIHCADIDAGSCYAGLTNLFTSGEGNQPNLACLNDAGTKAAVRACVPPVEPCP